MDLSIGDYKEMDLDRAKNIKTKGITIGSDRKIEDDKFFGLALRYGNGSSNIGRTVQKVDLESLTLNIYGIAPTNNNQYINAILGLSALRYANKYLGNISGNEMEDKHLHQLITELKIQKASLILLLQENLLTE